jgi:hypothetical protein
MKRARALVFLTLSAMAMVPGVPRSRAEVARPAPDLPFPVQAGKARSLSSFRGQPLVLLLADSPKRGSFCAQLKALEDAFDRLANRSTVVAVGFKKGNSETLRTNIPLVELPDGATACNAFELKGDFAIVLVGPDGNIDYQTGKVLNINRILEVMQNSFVPQKSSLREGARR